MATNQKGKESTFGRNFMNYVAAKLPYSGLDVLDTTDMLNPKYKYFENQGLRRPEVLSKYSVSQSNVYNNEGIGSIAGDKQYGEMMYANIQKDKGARIQDYRVMAAFAEVTDALDEICDETINKDGEGNIITLKLGDSVEEELSLEVRNTLKEECKKYLAHFELEDNGWSYFRDLLIEGEVYFEHILHSQHLEEGVLGVVRVPSELVDPIYTNIQNMLVKGFLYRKPKLDPENPTKTEDVEMIPMEQNQIVYVHSGIWNESKNIRMPFIENARRSYRQLSLIEDSIIIYRLVRAPERLVFNVDVGNMAPPKAEEYLRKLMNQYWATKTFDVNQNDVVQKFNPQSMLDSYWFAKRAGSDGTSVSQLAGGQNLGELTDLMYFLRKLYKALKVPVNRLENESFVSDPSQMLREELKFAKFIIRLQTHVAKSIKMGFVTHLKLKGIWDKHKIKENEIELAFNAPSNFYELRESQRLELKVNNYNQLAADEFVSPTYAQKKYLGWDDKDILTNRAYIRKDAEFQWEVMNIQNYGPGWKKIIKDQLEGGAPGEEMPGDLGAAGAGGGGGGMPPAFGGGMPETGADDAGGDAGVEPVDIPDAAPAE